MANEERAPWPARCPHCEASTNPKHPRCPQCCRIKEPKTIDDCIRPEDIARWLEQRGYKGVWLEDRDDGVVIHGISLAQDHGGFEVVIPEHWNNW